MIMVVAVNAGASVSSVFGAIILQNLAGFTPDEAVLLNMPFGVLQIVSILLASYLAYRFKRKSPFLLGLVTIVIVGVALMVALPKTKANKGGLLAGYYLLAFVFAINPLLLSWMGANCAGQTKKAIYYTSFNAANSIGNIITPYIFNSKFKPQYVSQTIRSSLRKLGLVANLGLPRSTLLRAFLPYGAFFGELSLFRLSSSHGCKRRRVTSAKQPASQETLLITP
jgi:predicted MFS family arabinose efflux permease